MLSCERFAVFFKFHKQVCLQRSSSKQIVNWTLKIMDSPVSNFMCFLIWIQIKNGQSTEPLVTYALDWSCLLFYSAMIYSIWISPWNLFLQLKPSYFGHNHIHQCIQTLVIRIIWLLRVFPFKYWIEFASLCVCIFTEKLRSWITATHRFNTLPAFTISLPRLFCKKMNAKEKGRELVVRIIESHETLFCISISET